MNNNMTEYKIEKPKIDKRKYEFIILDNKMEVLIIYDEDTNMSAASLSVGVGYNNDPKEYQGLAHFLEHMLFMGTKKYPDEHYYHKTITETGGNANAHTMSNNTTYYFQTINEHYLKCLDLFVQFFIEPLFNKDSIKREINAVNSEYEKNITHDGIRVSSILKSFVKNDHPYYNFGIGNKTTLEKPNIRKELLKFYDRYYSANQMKLVVLANKKVKDHIIKIFNKVKNKNIKHTEIKSLPFSSTNNSNGLCKNLIKVFPIADNNTLEIQWQIPILDKKYKPALYLSHLLGHESEGSIYYFLKEHNLCISLFSSVFDEDNTFRLFGISIILTEEGFKHVPAIIDCVYKYINMISKMKNAATIYEEERLSNQLSFDYSITGQKIDYVSSLSMNMLKYKPTKIISGVYMLNKYNDLAKQEIQKLLKYMTKKEAIIIISSKTYKKITNKTEKYYNVKYNNYLSPTTFGKEFNKNTLNYNPKLPEKNIFIPNKKYLHMRKPSGLSMSKIPLQLDLPDLPKSEIWYKYDDVFKIPKVMCELVLYNDEFYKKTENVILLSLYLSIIDNRINSKMYYANKINSGYSFGISSDNINISFSGYLGGIENIVDLYINTFLNIVIEEKEFNIAKYEMNNNLKNFIYQPPYLVAEDYFQEKLYNINYTREELTDSLKILKFKDIQKPKGYFLEKCKMRSFFYGNINKNIIHRIEEKFIQFCSTPAYMEKHKKFNLLENGEQHTYIQKAINTEETNNLIYLYFEVGKIIKKVTKDWDINSLCLSLLSIFINEKFFSQLRTKEQTGYVVKSFVVNFPDERGYVSGIVFMIQSPHIYPNDLRKRIKKFIVESYTELKKLPDKEIDILKNTLKVKLNRKFESQYDEFDFMMDEITSGEYAFDYISLLTNKIKKIDKYVLTNFYKKYMLDKNTRKIRILEMYKYKKID
jgi:insulysin